MQDRSAPFITVSRFPDVVITSISSVNKDITFSHNATGDYLSSCKYTVFNSTNEPDIVNSVKIENVSVICGASDVSVTVSSLGTYNLTVYAENYAGSENSSTQEFTTSTLVLPTGGGGVTVIENAELSTNFSLTSLTSDNILDLVLAKGSVRPREKTFILRNTGKDSFEAKLYCLADDNSSNICDYVSFENDTIVVSANEDSPTQVKVYVLVPENASFGDSYPFTILAFRDKKYAKLSVTSRVPVWGLIFKYSYFPFQDSDKEIKSSFPVFWVSLLFSFIIFGFILYVFIKLKFVSLGFFLSIILFVFSFVLFLVYL